MNGLNYPLIAALLFGLALDAALIVIPLWLAGVIG